jgi:P-type E1-E2 ATPase
LIIGIIKDGFESGWIEGSSIFLAVFIITAVTATNNYAKEK